MYIIGLSGGRWKKTVDKTDKRASITFGAELKSRDTVSTDLDGFHCCWHLLVSRAVQAAIQITMLGSSALGVMMQAAMRSCQTHSQIQLVLLGNLINKLGEEWRVIQETPRPSCLPTAGETRCMLATKDVCLCVRVTDGLSTVRRCCRGPPAETDNRRRLPSIPCCALFCQTGTLR